MLIKRIDHLIASIKKAYTLTKDWTGNLYCIICLDWDYTNPQSSFPCRGTLKRNCNSTVALYANGSRIAHTRLPQSNLVTRPSLHYPWTCCLNWIKQVSKGAEDSRQHFVLCMRHQHDCTHGPQHHCRRPDNSCSTDFGMIHANDRLPCSQCRCSGSI